MSRWLPWPHPRYGRSDALRFIRDSQAAWEEGRAHDFALRSHHDGLTHLGNISVWPTSRREQAGEVGYWVRSDRTQQGIATEAAARVLQVAFEEMGLHRVILRVAVGNRPSERVAEKLGFVARGPAAQGGAGGRHLAGPLPLVAARRGVPPPASPPTWSRAGCWAGPEAFAARPGPLGAEDHLP